jgi:hypothetical protein
MTMKEKPLNFAFGRDKAAIDVANNFSGSYWRGAVQKVMAALATVGSSYRGPRSVLNPGMNLTRVAAPVFNPRRRAAYAGWAPSAPEPK